MKRLLTLGFSLTFGLVAQANVPGDVGTAEYQKAQDLVTQLGNSRYKEREKAAAELMKMGRSAKVALIEGKKHYDVEIATRCNILLPQALSLDLAFRIDRFEKDTEGKLVHQLPFLKLYQEKVGSGAPERKLYSEILKAQAGFLDAAEEDPTRLSEKVRMQSTELYNKLYNNQNFDGGFKRGGRGGYNPSAVNAFDVAALMLAASAKEYKHNQNDYMLSSLFNHQEFQNQIRNGAHSQPLRKVFVAFITSNSDENLLNQTIYQLTNLGIKEAAPVLAKALADKKFTQPYSIGQALGAVGALGSKEQIESIEKCLKDDTMIQQFFNPRGGREQGEVKVKDVALAVSIHLSGKSPRDFGFTQWQIQPNQPIPYYQLGFTNKVDREKAFAKWEEEKKKAPAGKDEPKKPDEKKPEEKKPAPQGEDQPLQQAPIKVIKQIQLRPAVIQPVAPPAIPPVPQEPIEKK